MVLVLLVLLAAAALVLHQISSLQETNKQREGHIKFQHHTESQLPLGKNFGRKGITGRMMIEDGLHLGSFLLFCSVKDKDKKKKKIDNNKKKKDTLDRLEEG